MITEKSHGGYNIAFNAYKTALKILGNSSCTSSYINYRLGLLDEQNNFLYQAKHCYANAYKLHKDYHVLFRIAVMFENDLNYQGEISPGIDFNSITKSGTYSYGGTDNPNKPPNWRNIRGY